MSIICTNPSIIAHIFGKKTNNQNLRIKALEWKLSRYTQNAKSSNLQQEFLKMLCVDWVVHVCKKEYDSEKMYGPNSEKMYGPASL